MDQELLRKAIALAARGYQVQVQKEEGCDGTPIWVAYVPEMPSCLAQADSLEGAKEALKVVREDYIYFRLKRGVPVPDPKFTPNDTKTKVGSYSRTPQSQSSASSYAVGPRIRPANRSYEYTGQATVARLSHSAERRKH